MLWDFSKWPEYRGGHISGVLIRVALSSLLRFQGPASPPPPSPPHSFPPSPPPLQHGAYRTRLLSKDKNTIDCVVVDKRGSPDTRAAGNKVVICCEGNAAYYELGMMLIPLSCKYRGGGGGGGGDRSDDMLGLAPP